MKPKQISIRTKFREELRLPNTKEGVWFNIEHGKRGIKAETCVVSPSEFVTISQKSFSEILNLCDNKTLKKLTEYYFGDNKKALVFRRMIETKVADRKNQKGQKRGES